MIQNIENRLTEAFLILNIRQSERTTAEEVRMTQAELEQALGGLFSLLTTEFLIPYLNRTLLVLQRTNQIPRLPKDLVRPKIVAGVNALGRARVIQEKLNTISYHEHRSYVLGEPVSYTHLTLPTTPYV